MRGIQLKRGTNWEGVHRSTWAGVHDPGILLAQDLANTTKLFTLHNGTVWRLVLCSIRKLNLEVIYLIDAEVQYTAHNLFEVCTHC